MRKHFKPFDSLLFIYIIFAVRVLLYKQTFPKITKRCVRTVCTNKIGNIDSLPIGSMGTYNDNNKFS